MSLDAASASYMVKTRDGDKGPFSRKQICKLVVKGQLPETVKVRDVESNKPVLVADIVSGKAYENIFEDEALGVASDLIEEAYDSGIMRAPGRQEVESQSARSRLDDREDRSSGSSHRRTQSHRRRSGSSRLFESEVSEGVQRGIRSKRRQQNKQMLLIAGVIVGLCAVAGVVVMLLPGPPLIGSMWASGSQELTIGRSTIKLEENGKRLIHANYTEVAPGVFETFWSEGGELEIRCQMDGDTLTTWFNNADKTVWTRRY